MAISKETIQYVAHLSRLDLKQPELDKFSAQLAGIIGFIDKLSNADINQVAPTSHILPINNVLREDRPKESLPVEKALENSPQREGSFFTVPKVIE